MKRPLLFSAGLLLILTFSAIAILSERERRVARAEEQHLNEIRRRDSAELENVRAEIQQAESTRRALTVPSAARSKAPPQRSKMMDIGALLRANPHLEALKLEAQAALIRTKYEPLFRQLSLSPEQIARFGNLVTENEARQNDTAAALREQGLAIDSPEARKTWGLVWSDYRAAQRELLGDVGVVAWEQYERTTFIRGAATAFAGAATLRGTPMTSQQVEQLTNAMAEASASYRKGGHAATSDMDWPAVLNAMAPVLSPEQLAAVNSIEPQGPLRFGGRHLMGLQAAIVRAVAADKNASEPVSGP